MIKYVEIEVLERGMKSLAGPTKREKLNSYRT
jgi:hypothetical protein